MLQKAVDSYANNCAITTEALIAEYELKKGSSCDSFTLTESHC